jgi:hypothetical protein
MTNLISDLSDLCDLAKKGKSLIEKHFHTEIQKEILKSAAKSGEFHILHSDNFPYQILRAGGRKMGDENDPSSLTSYFKAFETLCSSGYIEHVSGAYFRLTVSGLEKARKL